MSGLWLNLETELPHSLPSGQGTALFLFGTCFHQDSAVAELELLVDGVAHPVTAAGMPRFDLYRSLHPGLGDGRDEALPDEDPTSEEDPGIRSYRSGFWATVPVAGSTSPITIAARARLEGGGEVVAEVGRIGIDQANPEPAATSGERIVICMATFNPDLDLLRTQIESLREQTDEDWICIVSDDCSTPELFRGIEAEVAGDQRFVLARSERRRGFYRSFERVLELVPPDARLIALCDQDDRWYPEKLARLRAGLGDAHLVYSDQRLVDEGGDVLADTYWSRRRNNHTNLESLLIANTITGAASLMRREVVDRALPFPDVPGEQYHDHWLGLVAMTLGRVAYVDEPLYDYVQHGGAMLGHTAANAGIGRRRRMPLREALNLGHIRRMLADGPAAYFHAYVRLQILAVTLLVRCGGEVSWRKRRALTRFVRAERSPVSWLRLALRPLRRLIGRNETLGVERLLAKGVLWRHALAIRARGVVRPAGWTYGAGMPSRGDSVPAAAHGDAEVRHIQRIMRPLQLSVSSAEPERVNVLIPTVDLKHLFGGYIAKFNLALRLAAAGRRVRIVAVDPTPPLPSDWREQVESYSGLTGALSEVEIVFADDRSVPVPVNPEDVFIATTWWTAHVARAAVRQTNRERFLYLIQEYEPFTFEMGSLAALAMQSYEFPHVALFSTEFLRTFFARYGHGVFAAGPESGKRDSISFRNAITAVRTPTLERLAEAGPRRLLFYARAEAHARRNMFELGLIALSEAVEGGVFGPGWEYFGIGSVSGRSRIALPGGAELEVLSRLGQADYAEILGGYDVGLSLMFTPHPSLVPLEMASAGMLTVTNSYDTKTAKALTAISPNLIAAEPSVEGVIEGLRQAVARVGDLDSRIAGANVDWPDTWEDSFSDGAIHEIDELLKRC